uniref:SMB domain-containing protein n=1 Tax=Macrostomum lignano TaxID=282301 RepID=A0A1I8HBI9_9PLAT
MQLANFIAAVAGAAAVLAVQPATADNEIFILDSSDRLAHADSQHVKRQMQLQYLNLNCQSDIECGSYLYCNQRRKRCCAPHGVNCVSHLDCCQAARHTCRPVDDVTVNRLCVLGRHVGRRHP